MKHLRTLPILLAAALFAGSCTSKPETTEGATTTERPRNVGPAGAPGASEARGNEDNNVTITEDRIRLFVAAPTGVSMRAQPNATAPEVAHPLYGYELAYSTDPAFKSNSEKTSTEGIPGYWIPVTYKGKTGYVSNVTVLPFPPPQARDSGLKAWMDAIAKPIGPRFEQKPDWDKMAALGTGIVRQLYNNGGIYSEGSGYEWGHTMIQLPATNIGSVLYALRNVPGLGEVLKESGALRRGNYSVKRPGSNYGEYKWKVNMSSNPYGEYLEGVEVEFEDGGYQGIKVMQVQADVVVISYGGV